MKKLLFALMLTFASLSLCQAQQIEMKKTFFGTQYIHYGHKMSMGELVNLMDGNSEAQYYMKGAKMNGTIGMLLSGVGGVLVGYPVGTAIGNAMVGDVVVKPLWAMAGIGAGMIVVGIPLAASADRKSKRAIEIYNESLGSSSFRNAKPKNEFFVSINGNGIGLSMTF